MRAHFETSKVIDIGERKESKMTRNELEKMLETALLQRKQGYKLNVSRHFITHINNQIRDLKNQIATLEEVAA